MAISTYDRALALLLAHEGGYCDHPADPGGPTNFGITIADARRYGAEFGWIANPAVADIKAMPLAFAKAVYRAKYWRALRCDELPAGVDYALFDYGVNSGVARAGKVLRRLLQLPADTLSADERLIAAARAQPAAQLVAAICRERLAFLQSLKTWPVFGVGWSRRVADVERQALAFAAAATRPGQELLAPKRASGKGIVPAGESAQRTTTGAVVATGAGAAQAAHHAGFSPRVVIALVVIAFVLAGGCWLFWHWRQRRRQERSIGPGDQHG